MNANSVGRFMLLLVVRPSLWIDAFASVARLARRGWWRRFPPVPVPDPRYIAWRAQTANGDADRSASETAEDMVAYLTFCRGLRRSRRN